MKRACLKERTCVVCSLCLSKCAALSFFCRQNNWERAESQSMSDVTATPAAHFIDGSPWAVISLVFSRTWKRRLLLQGAQSYGQNTHRSNVFKTLFFNCYNKCLGIFQIRINPIYLSIVHRLDEWVKWAIYAVTERCRKRFSFVWAAVCLFVSVVSTERSGRFLKITSYTGFWAKHFSRNR